MRGGVARTRIVVNVMAVGGSSVMTVAIAAGAGIFDVEE